MIIEELLKKGFEELEYVDEGVLKTRMLLADVLECHKEYLVIHNDDKVESKYTHKFLKGIERLKAGEPIQYVTEKAEFYGLEFYVNKNVLIPQPDTEVLVGEIIEKYSKSESITDLTGTTWRFNNHITYNNGFRFTINGSVFDTTRRYDCTGILTVEESGYYVLCWSLVNENHPYENNSAFAFIPQNELGFPPGWVWGSFATYSVSPCSSPSMTIAGGTDATNPDFITWLQTNAEQIN